MKVRLVAYRPATTSETADSTYQLDLQEEPSIALNFQFSDIKEPDTRKSSYSQTFKLPFTDNNHQFFQDWYNVNIATLVYDTRTKFNATLYMGTVPQFEGSLQLKGVYQKAQVYEVVLMSNTADLFSVIGEKKLRDTLRNDDGTYSEELNHQFNETQMENSWNGGSSAFVNSAAVSLRDTDADVQKVMYPLSVTQPEFYWGQGSNQFLDMTAADVTNYGPSDAFPYMASLLQFRPAIQIRTLLKLIIARAGFSYTSEFIDNDYFGKIFMTTGNHLGESTLPTVNTNDTSFAGNFTAGNSGPFGYFGSNYFPLTGLPCVSLPPQKIEANTVCDPITGTTAWDTTYDYFTKEHPTQTQIYVRHRIYYQNVQACESGEDMLFDIYLEGWDATDNEPMTTDVWDFIGGVPIGNPNQNYNHYFNISNMPLNYSCRIMIRAYNIKRIGGTLSATMTLGNTAGNTFECNLDSQVSVTWDNYSLGIYDAIINMPMCIDPDITQKDFLKDIIQRFNLVILSDPDDSSNLLIEPYNDYLADSSIKDWTKKLDTSKEVIVRDTTSLQKKSVYFTDLEDEDSANKSFKEKYPKINVYGHADVQVTNNQFATGDLTNNPIFSPYINNRVYVNEYQGIESYPRNMVVQYELSYERNEDGIKIPVTSAETKPKLFWYNGTATTVRNSNDDAITYNLHHQPVSGQAINTETFNTYPVCTPYDITPVSDAYTLSPTTKSLYWWTHPPITASDIFNFSANNGTWSANTLYGLYWKPYLDNIYNTDARIMECNLNLNEVDIFNFKFNDEIFIKETYWRILNISNYQVGGKSSTKVKLLKVIDALNNCSDCNYVPGFIDGSNIYNDTLFLWCPEGTPNCTPTIPTGLYTSEACCECQGGVYSIVGSEQGNALAVCELAGSLPLVVQDQINLTSILGLGTLRNVISDTLGGLNKPLIHGLDNDKYSRNIIPSYGDDIMIKYKSKRKTVPQLQGESHKIILTGYTEGNTRSYGYPEGSENNKPLILPTDINCVLKVKGVSTVIGGKSAIYVLGTTEAFSYHSGFKNTIDGPTQLSTAGGVVDFRITESGITPGCSLYIDMSNSLLRFGLDDTQTDTKRIWSLTVELDINRIANFSLGYDENFALYQNGQYILFENGNLLIWN
jgi:hypothetical protein